MTTGDHVDVVIIGAGISGVGAAWHLRDKCPNKSFALLEGRNSIGGTWDLFRYPGVRSDTDMFTFGYKFKPWINTQTMADGRFIREYIQETAQENGIVEHIRFGHKVTRAAWSSDDARWTVTATREDGTTATLTCNFLMMCSGYYRYEAGHSPEFKGRESFGGQIVHPQAWPEGFDYSGKRVLVIGSGATAITLVPSMAPTAAHVTMLQRSPTYLISLPRQSSISRVLRLIMPNAAVHFLMRMGFLLGGAAMYHTCKRFPEFARRTLLAGVRRQLKGASDMKHFTPNYKPWDQRLCVVPDGDMFRCIREGKVDVVTDQIDRITPQGVLLESGQTLEADVIVTATGLDMRYFGGVEISIDGVVKPMNETITYKGVMFTGVPNLSLTVGYINASHTLRADVISEYVCRLLNAMDERGARQVMARHPGDHVGVKPMLMLTSGFVVRARAIMPRQGEDAPWQLPQSYRRDIKALKVASLDDPHLVFSKPSKSVAEPVSAADALPAE